MQFTIATIALFASTVLALPAPAPVQSATVKFTDEMTGFSGNVVVPLNGNKINLYNSLAGTPVGPKIPGARVGGPQYRVLASSAMLVIPYPQNAACIVSGISTTVLGDINARKTHTNLNPLVQGFPLIDLNGATIKCTPTGKAKRQDPAAVAHVGPATADDIVPDDFGVTVDASSNVVPVDIPRPATTVPDAASGDLYHIDASGNRVDAYGRSVDATGRLFYPCIVLDASEECPPLNA